MTRPTEDNQNNNNGQGAGGTTATADEAKATAEAIQNYMARLMNENAGLKDMVGRLTNKVTTDDQTRTQEQLEKLDEKEQLRVYKTAVDQFRAASDKAKQEAVSQTAWQTATANAAADLLKTVGLTVNEPGLYRGEFDVNWMPNFVKSVQNVLVTKQQQSNNNGKSDPNKNPANSANVSKSGTNTIPDLEWDKLSGYETIQAALSRGSKS